MSAERQKVVSEKPARVYEHPLFTYVNDQKALCVKGRTVHITRRESQLMQVLSTVPNEAVTHQDLFRRVNDSDFISVYDGGNMRGLVLRLRKILRDLIGDHEIIRNSRGRGYTLIDKSRPHHQEEAASS